MQKYSIPEIEKRIKTMLLGVKPRVIATIISCAVLIFIRLVGKINIPLIPLLFLAFLQVVLNQPYPFIVKRLRNLEILSFFHMFIDVLVITSAIHLLGGIEFSFLGILYLLPILAHERIAFWGSTLSALAYGGLIGLEHYGLLPHYTIFGLQVDPSYQLFIVFIYILIFYSAALLSNYISKLVKMSDLELAESRKELELWSRELAKRVEERTKQLKRTIEDLKIITAEKTELAVRAEALAKAEREKAAELEKSQEAYLNVMEDLDMERRKLEQILNELKATQTQLVQAGKMAGIGQLAAGVAHEINNPLTTAYGFVELLLDEVRDSSVQKDLKKVKTSIERCKDITTRLLSFAKPAEAKKMEPTDINQILKQIISLMANQLVYQRIKVVQKLTPALPKVMAVPSELQEVYMNIIFNARKAMSEGGVLALETKKTKVNQKEYVEISISDTGSGILPENLDRIFEPFFTTKEPGKGAGLGLSVSYGIVKEHGGTIEVKSKVGKGTTFVIRLPVGRS